MRRIAPEGLATAIGWTANFRTLRHVIELRTDPAAEWEIRYVFGEVAKFLINRYPNAFGDLTSQMVDGLPYYTSLAG
jgi:thymidylate synthase (FAD)